MLHLLLLFSKTKAKWVCDSLAGISTHIIKLVYMFIELFDCCDQRV